jgi:hypothetical protein
MVLRSLARTYAMRVGTLGRENKFLDAIAEQGQRRSGSDMDGGAA